MDAAQAAGLGSQRAARSELFSYPLGCEGVGTLNQTRIFAMILQFHENVKRKKNISLLRRDHGNKRHV